MDPDARRPSPVIRRLASSDSIPELTRLLHRSYRRLRDMGLHYVATDQDDDTTRRRIAAGECYVAVLDGSTVAGTILFLDAASTRGCPYYDKPGVSSFHQFAVDVPYQGMGIGRRLLDTVEARALESGATEIALDTAEGATHLIDRYRRWGYRIVGQADWEETNYLSVIMSKPLGDRARGDP